MISLSEMLGGMRLTGQPSSLTCPFNRSCQQVNPRCGAHQALSLPVVAGCASTVSRPWWQ